MVGTAFLLITTYLIGRLPTVYLIGKIFTGIDLRLFGGQRLGPVAILKMINLEAALTVIILDFVKGALAVFLGSGSGNSFLAALAGVAVLTGARVQRPDVFPGLLGVLAGALLILVPPVFGPALAVWLAMLLLLRSTLWAARGGWLAAVILVWIFYGWGAPELIGGLTLLAMPFLPNPLPHLAVGEKSHLSRLFPIIYKVKTAIKG